MRVDGRSSPFLRRRRRFSSSPPSAAAVDEGGDRGSGVRLVNRVWMVVAGGGVWVGAASASSALLSPSIRPLLAGAICCGDGSEGVLPRGWCSDGSVFVKWRFRPRARSSTWCRLLRRQHGALRYVGGFRVVLRPAQVRWSKEGGFTVGVPWRRWLDLWLGEGWRCSFNVPGSVAVRRTTLVFEACRSSLVLGRGWCGLVFSGDGEGDAVALGRVFPLRVILLYVRSFVLCFS